MKQSSFLILIITILVVALLNNIDKSVVVAAGLKEADILRYNVVYPADDELALLPKCCGVKRKAQPYEAKRIPMNSRLASNVNACKKRVGVTVWTYMHHYCAGLNRIKRYYLSKQLGIGVTGLTDLQKKTLQRALSELHYAESHYVKFPEYTIAMKYIAIAWWELGNYHKSFNALYRGIRVQPRYPVLYLQLAKVLNIQGQKTKAMKVLQKGLKATGGNKKIRDMLASLK